MVCANVEWIRNCSTNAQLCDTYYLILVRIRQNSKCDSKGLAKEKLHQSDNPLALP